jgi:hypothetical protein
METVVMKSPFPGMDPYLESKWPEVHASLIVYARNQLNQQLPDDLQANIEENLAVRVEDDDSHSIRPDVNVAEDREFSTPATQASNIAVAQPLVLARPPHPERHVEIVNQAGRVITAIEFVSPWNKVGILAREKYARKQLDYLAAGLNLVEIDLVRQGGYVLAAPLEDLPEDQRTPYLICVYRDTKPHQFEVYRAPLQEPLPNIRIPLRPGEPDVVLQLQPLIDACYRDGRYHRINYQVDPKPKFDEQHARWIDSLLRAQGRRT